MESRDDTANIAEVCALIFAIIWRIQYPSDLPTTFAYDSAYAGRGAQHEIFWRSRPLAFAKRGRSQDLPPLRVARESVLAKQRAQEQHGDER